MAATSEPNGLTNSNYTELTEIYEKYKDQGLEILLSHAISLDLRNQAPMKRLCTHFKAEYPIFNKIEVNGEKASSLYKFLKSGKWGIFGDDIQWNFAKFLVNKCSQIFDRYYPTTSPLSLGHDIRKLLGV